VLSIIHSEIIIVGNNKMTKRILMVLTSIGQIPGTERKCGWFLPELAHPYLRFIKAGYVVEICSINGGVAPISPDSIDLKDTENKEFWEHPTTRALTENTRSLASYSGADFDCVFFVGGLGVMWDFPFDLSVDRVGREVYEHGGIIGSVCHGPIALANIKNSSGEPIVRGKQVAGFTNEEEVFIKADDHYPVHPGGGKSCEDVLSAGLIGGIYSKTSAFGVHVTSDSRVISGQNPASAGPTAEAIIVAFGY